MRRFVFCSLLAAALAACGGSTGGDKPGKGGDARGGGGPGGKQGPPTVMVAPVAMHAFTDAIEAVGTAKAIDSVIISANVTERIKALHFRDGQMVRKGDLLVELSANQQRADLAGARAQLQQAESQLKRQMMLRKDGWTTQARIDEAIATRDSARARVETIKAEIGDRTIRAPFSGTIGLRDVSAGLVAGSSTPILELTDLSRIRVDFTVPETQLGALFKGQEVQVQAAAFPDAHFTGTVEAIDPQIDPVSRSASIRALLPNHDARLKPGMLLNVRIIRTKRNALAVPEQAVISQGTERSVFSLNSDGQTVEQTRVMTGAREPGLIEITDGLAEGARIVTDGALKVRDGGKIRIFGEAPRKDAKPEARSQ